MLNKPLPIAETLPFHIGSLIWVRNNDQFNKYRLVSALTEFKRMEIQGIYFKVWIMYISRT